MVPVPGEIMDKRIECKSEEEPDPSPPDLSQSPLEEMTEAEGAEQGKLSQRRPARTRKMVVRKKR